ncbi:unnamed protein product [Cuscuta campestris]|uniref:Uncharacterized protein n=1 Tax=Cuscuta campestris TaxID=132261 RepID=A0A484KWU7_9ASTE|nr:unnamed protein product [Cuscuta campestris]
MRCPCKICKNKYFKDIEDIKLHVLRQGFTPKYLDWVCNGEEHGDYTSHHQRRKSARTFVETEMAEYMNMVIDAAGPSFNPYVPVEEEPNASEKKFDMLKAADTDLWKGCTKMSQLSMVARLLNIKAEHNLSERCYDTICQLFKDGLPKDNSMVSDFYETKKLIEDHVYTRLHSVPRNDEGDVPAAIESNLSIFQSAGRLSGKTKKRRLSDDELKALHHYLMLNSVEIEPFIEKYVDSLRDSNLDITDEALLLQMEESFASWFEKHAWEIVDTLQVIRDVSRGPLPVVSTYPICYVNGYRFHTETHSAKRATFNSGVSIVGEHCSYYGRVEEIIEAFIQPFILATQAKQVAYVEYPRVASRAKGEWLVVCDVKPRGWVETTSDTQKLKSTDDFEYQEDARVAVEIVEVEPHEEAPLLAEFPQLIDLDDSEDEESDDVEIQLNQNYVAMQEAVREEGLNVTPDKIFLSTFGGHDVKNCVHGVGDLARSLPRMHASMADQRKKKKVIGAGKCEKLYKRRREGHSPIELEWEHGEPIRGPYVSEFSGLVGFEVRSRVPITYSNWHDVPQDLRATVLDGVRALSEKNRDIQKKNSYPHYMGRGGYAMLQCEFAVASQAATSADIAGSSTLTSSQLGREDSWLRGYTPGRQAEVMDPAVMEIRDRIVQLKKEVAAGTFVSDGHNDVLTRALGTAEHPGCTRGVGSYSGLRKVFKGNMKPRKPEEGAYMSQHTPSVPPHYGQRSSKASTDFVDVAGVTKVSPCYLRISDPADYIVAHRSVFPRAPGDMVHGVPLLPHQVKVSVTLVLPGMGEYTIPCPTEHMETVADCEGSFVAWPKSLVGVEDPLVQTARHDDFSSSKSRPILSVRPTAPSSAVQDVVDRSSYVAFGLRCRELCQWLTRTSALPTISVILNPESMLYPEETELRMRPENIREFMRREEVDQTIIIIFFKLLHDHMMERGIAFVGLLCPENIAYVVEYGDRQYLDRALETYQS